MAEAVYGGATNVDISGVDVVMEQALQADASHLLRADALILGTPENFGYMSGGMKDFLDRTFYEVEGKFSPLPYGVFIGAGNDGTGALTAIQRIAKGYPFIESHEPILVVGELTEDDLQRCTDLGMFFAAALEAGVF